jgi:hypothetical protein
VLGIGAAAFLLSYDALHSLALASGVRPGLARIWPGVLDGFIVVATLTVVAAKRASRPTWYPWALVVLFSAASVAFNILHAVDQTLAAAGGGNGQQTWSVAGCRREDATRGREPWPARTGIGWGGGDRSAVDASCVATISSRGSGARDRARRLYVEAQAAGRKLTGADLGRALGTSDSYGRLLLREFRTSHPALGNGTARGEA